MKVARFAAAPLAVAALFLSTGCSDPPAPPPQGAVSLVVTPSPGLVCSHTNGQLSVPTSSVAGVLEALNCDLTKEGCKPDEFVVVDRDRGSTVQCSVVPNGGTYTVSARLRVDGTQTGDPSVSFGVSGIIGPTGGNPVTVNQQNSVSMGGGNDNTCIVSIDEPRGKIKPGGIWGHVKCTNFRNENDISETGCTLEAVFLFENCSG